MVHWTHSSRSRASRDENVFDPAAAHRKGRQDVEGHEAHFTSIKRSRKGLIDSRRSPRRRRDGVDTGRAFPGAVCSERRDAAGKGGTINAITQRLNPRQVHVIALAKPTYACPASELPFLPTGFAVAARPSEQSAGAHHVEINAATGTNVDIGTVAPAFGHADGGVEACFSKGAKNASAPPTVRPDVADEWPHPQTTCPRPSARGPRQFASMKTRVNTRSRTGRHACSASPEAIP
jgi:hypothetical protein